MSNPPLIVAPQINSEGMSPFFAPFHRLPFELLQIIFDIARRNPPSMAPFTLSHVCRKWRSFLLESPSLWTTIVIGHPLPNFRYHSLWFDRSQRLGLSIHLTHELTVKEAEILNQVFSFADRRCKEINVSRWLSHSDWAAMTVMGRLSWGGFSGLTDLRLPHLQLPYSMFLAVQLRLFPMPDLESLAIHTHLFHLSPEWFSACEHLRQLHLTYDQHPTKGISFAPLYQIIQPLSARLEDLRVHVPGRYHNGEILVDPKLPIGVLLLPRLANLDLSCGDDNWMGDLFMPFLRQILAPNLLSASNVSVSALTQIEYLYQPRRMKSLGFISDYHTKGTFTKEMVPPFLNAFSRLSNLHSVTFAFFQWHDGEFATALLNSCPQLIRVLFQDCSSVHEKDLRRLVEGRKMSEDVASLYYLGVLDCDVKLLDEGWFGERLKVFECTSWQ